MAESEIRAKLVVKHDPAQVKAESAAAAKSASQGASQAAANIGKLTSVSGEEMQRIMAQRAATKAKWDAIERERAARIAQNERTKPSTGLQQFINQTLGPRPLVGPSGPEFWGKTIPPVLVPPKLGQKTKEGEDFVLSPLMVAAGVGAALAGLRVAVGYARFALNALVTPLRMFRDEMKKAADQARATYSSAMQSGGLPLGFTVHRDMMANIIGVGNDEVLQYGNAVEYLTERLKTASNAVASTATGLTEMSYSTRSLGESIKASRSVVASDFSKVVKSLSDKLREKFDEFAETWPRATIAEKTQWLPTIPKLVVASMLAQNEAIKKKEGDELKSIVPWGRRMPTSSWEKMGMVVGKMPGDTLKDIARNTMGTWNAIKALNSQGSSAMGNSINFRP